MPKALIVIRLTELRHQAIKQTIPTSYSAPLMSRIQEKIHAEVALETAEISKTAFYLPPVHKRKQIPYVENVDSRSLSPNSGRRSAASGFTEKDEFERQKRLTLKKYNFPSNAPILKSPREMQEPYAFLSQQLIASNKNSKHEKARAQTKTAKVKVTIDVSQVMKDAETLLQTAKLALRQSRVQAQKAAAVTPSCALGHERPERQSFSPSSLNASPGSPFGARLDSQTPNVLNNSPIAQALNSVQKSALSTEKYASNHTGPIIRIFKAELAPIASNRTKIKNVGAGARATELNDAKRDALQNVATVKADLHDIGSEPKMKSLIGMEKSST